MVASPQSDTIRHPPSSYSTNAYQEEMCEKLIQLSFVKIVSSKSERGGARLRKNLLILHLLQRARLEQRNRLFAAAVATRNAVASQQPEVTNDSIMPMVNMVRKEEENGDLPQPRECNGFNEEGEKIDLDASFSQQATAMEEPPPPTPAPTPEVSAIRERVHNQDGETSRTLDASPVANAHADILPRSNKDDWRRDPISYSPGDQGASDTCSLVVEVADAENNGHSQFDRSTSTSSECNEEIADNKGDKSLNRRACLKRKHDSLENATSAHDWSSSAKVACVAYHRTPTSESAADAPSITQQANTSPTPNLNGFFSVLKTATLTSSNAESGDGDGNSKAVAPLSRSLSCSSFMELTCES